ncbi:3-oxoacyl-ACP synthase III [Shewanella xiamenensis]|jgi:3-oxoacyl-[acyl-carrier-protein] synthase-3|uniref:3-oxoacyl-ACP synthase III n=6 Tax=Shewanella TaxID=22 RepID=A0A073KQF9_9GAMM|nr:MULTISPECIES: 3-oxoacyl-ACP synthase III [Shewanella]VEE60617.1 3-oxoacyl-[acyl-carrier-protein] synthase 3 [Shewanella putrefaciens]ABK48942.1 3-Oxoacyl-(acyl-carrier-protein (ACP)) synthase III C terminal domain protein [Shewanella sp. ANA-3]ASF14863.1 3-oxoacyl-ACP synthase III [Shewanella sp. FDAARGOS_354]ASK68704.1 3-oxoacyl-ACP synthase III [Shewanella bicestrii]ESE40938.1 3-oxoacyl-acp synthase III [Shewanella decolorationis S12]
MKYSRVFINSLAYELAPVVVSSSELESRLAPLYQKFRIPMGQLAALTGITERRWWPKGHQLSDGAIKAAHKAIAETGIEVAELGAVVYTGVCRDQHEPATACRIAAALGVSKDTAIYDISNACLGVLSGILDIANRIELGQIKAGMVVSCESARDIVDVTIDNMLADPTMQNFAQSLATLTGGSGAVAVILTDGSLPLTNVRKHQLLGASHLSAPQHHQLCQWGLQEVGHNIYREFMRTDAVTLLKEGVELAKHTWEHFLAQRNWLVEQVDKVICHQVGASNRKQVLSALNIPPEKEFPTYQLLGNMGTVSLPVTAAMAHDQGFLRPGDQVSFLGIGSGLNCMMLGIKW